MHIIATAADAAWKVLLVGLLFGAGLPLIFAFGVRLLGLASPDRVELSADGVTVRDAAQGARAGAAKVGAWACFAVVVAAIVIGVLFLTKASIKHYTGIELPF